MRIWIGYRHGESWTIEVATAVNVKVPWKDTYALAFCWKSTYLGCRYMECRNLTLQMTTQRAWNSSCQKSKCGELGSEQMRQVPGGVGQNELPPQHLHWLFWGWTEVPRNANLMVCPSKPFCRPRNMAMLILTSPGIGTMQTSLS